MGVRGLQFVAFFAMGMGLLVAFVAIRQASLPLTEAQVNSALVPVTLAFSAIGMVASMASAALKTQAKRIADLERRLSESH